MLHTFEAMLESGELLSMFPYGCIVPTKTPERVKKAFLAGAFAEQAGRRSLDHLLKTEGDQWPVGERMGKEGRYTRAILSRALRAIHGRIRWWTDVTDKNTPLGQFAAGAALLRLKIAFQVASFLIRFGCTYEAAAILRVSLEQIAWAHAVHSLGDDEERVFGTKSTSSVTSLKQLIPEVGRLYGLLSRLTHIDEQWHKSFVEPVHDDLVITHRTHELRPELALLLLELADLYCVVTEIVYSPEVPGAENITVTSDGEVTVLEERRLNRAKKRYWKLYDQSAMNVDGMPGVHSR